MRVSRLCVIVWISFSGPVLLGTNKRVAAAPQPRACFFGGTEAISATWSCERLKLVGGVPKPEGCVSLGMQVTSKAQSRTTAGAGRRNSARSSAKRIGAGKGLQYHEQTRTLFAFFKRDAETGSLPTERHSLLSPLPPGLRGRIKKANGSPTPNGTALLSGERSSQIAVTLKKGSHTRLSPLRSRDYEKAGVKHRGYECKADPS